MDEIHPKIVELLLGNTNLVTLLGAQDAIYLDYPPQSPVLPCITYRLLSSPDGNLDRYGKLELTLILTIHSRSRSTNDSILEELDSTLFDTRFTTTSWEVKSFRRTTSEDSSLPGPLPLRLTETRWKLIAYRR